MSTLLPFAPYQVFLAQHFTFKVQKIAIDAGFTCPNRDGNLGVGGCTYCNNQTFNPTYCQPKKTITQQLEEGKAFFERKYKEMHYLAYFQAYTNTYADVAQLMQYYEEALSVPRVVGIVIGTRPDCVSETLLAALQQLSQRTFVHIEYGIETTDDTALRAVNRGHTFAQSVTAIQRTAACGICVGGHLILGLPGESPARIFAQAKILSQLPLDTVKFHHLQIIKGTRMHQQYHQSPETIPLFTPHEYVAVVAEMLLYLRPTLIVERFTAQAPPNLLVAPQWGIKNYEFTHLLQRYMREREWYQGMRYVSSNV